MLELPNHGPPSQADLIAIFISGAAAGIVATARSLHPRARFKTVAARLAVIFMGAVVGWVCGAITIAYGVDPVFAVAVSAIFGALAESLFGASYTLGRELERDPVALARRALGKETPDTDHVDTDPDSKEQS